MRRKEYGAAKTLYNRWKRWSDKGFFPRMTEALATPQAPGRKTIMIDATYLKAHRTAPSLRKKGGAGRLIERTNSGMNTKLHAVTDANGRPISFFITAGQVSDYTGATTLLDSLPDAQWMLAERGHDADRLRCSLASTVISGSDQ